MIKVKDLVTQFGLEAVVTIRSADGEAYPVKYLHADEAAYNDQEDVFELLSNHDVRDLERRLALGDDGLNFFSVAVLDS